MGQQPSLREKLGDADEAVRTFAAEDAGFDDRAEDVEPLLERLGPEPSRLVREAIVAALSRMTHAAVGERAIRLLGSDDAFLRSAAVSVLQSRGQEAIGPIERELPRADADVRKLLLDAASTLPGGEAERVLLLGLDDPDVNVRIAAVEYLGERARPDLKGRFEALAQAEGEPMLIATALAALEPVGDAASWALLERRYLGADGFPPFFAPQLLRLMAKCGPESCLGRLFDEQPRLGAAGFGDWLDALEVFHERYPFDRLSDEQFGALRRLVEAGPGSAHRLRLLKWLGGLGRQPGVVPTLGAYLESPDPTVRLGAALGLGRVGGAEARAALAERLPKERDGDVRAAIREGAARERATRS